MGSGRGARGRTGVFDGLTLKYINKVQKKFKTGHWQAKQLGILEFYTWLSPNKPYWQWPQHHTTAAESSNCTFSLKKELQVRKHSTASQTQEMHDRLNIEHIYEPICFTRQMNRSRIHQYNQVSLNCHLIGVFGQIHMFRVTHLYTLFSPWHVWIRSEFLKSKGNGKLNIKKDL